MIPILVLSALLVSSAFSSPLLPTEDIEAQFDAWAQEHGKLYRTEDSRSKALETYASNSAIIASLNAGEKGTAVYGHNEFSDMTPEEFNHRFPLNMDPEKGKAGGLDLPIEAVEDAPAEFDWRLSNAVSPVKNQGPCGSCWAESAVESVESVFFLAQKERPASGPEPLSTEQVVECDEYDYACYGGYPSHAYKYIIESGGLATAESYPYDLDGKTICLANQTFNETCGDGMCDDPPLTSWCDLTCSDKKHTAAASIKSWQALPNDEEKMKGFLATTAPISVAIDASGRFGALLPWLQFYRGGVADPSHCSTTVLDHAVFVVGYGTDSGKDYWTVKNSWGAKWGEDGYFRLVRGEGKCGINTMATSAIA